MGALDAWMWAREPRDADRRSGGICESTRWIESYERLAERAADVAETRLVQAGDRESDILALLQRAQALGWPADLLVRSQHTRRLPDGALLSDALQAEQPPGVIEFTVGARAGRSARVVRQEIRVKRVCVDHGKDGAIEMSRLVASEIGAPAGEKPLCWRLLTNRLAETAEQARELIEWYCARWEVEMLFHVLKTGCRVEALQLAILPKIERALALFMVVSWRIARLMRLARTCPDLPASLMFDADELEGAYVLTEKPLPGGAAQARGRAAPRGDVGRLPGAQGRWRAGSRDHLARSAARHGLRRRSAEQERRGGRASSHAMNGLQGQRQLLLQ